MSYPTAVTTFTNPTATNKLNNPSHSAQHSTVNVDLAAVETKLGTGTSAATANTVLLGTGSGTTAYGKPTAAYFDADFALGWMLVTDAWTYASADSPTFQITVPTGAAAKYSVGMKIRLTQTTVKYFIITVVADTTLTIYGGTDYSLVNAAISAIAISLVKTPIGFPPNPTKWTVRVADTTERSQTSPTTDTWYNLGSQSITIPIGVWNTRYQGNIYNSSGTQAIILMCTLSTANNSESDTEFTSFSRGYVTSTVSSVTYHRSKVLNISVKTPYYFNSKVVGSSPGNLFNENQTSPLILEAICAYL